LQQPPDLAFQRDACKALTCFSAGNPARAREWALLLPVQGKQTMDGYGRRLILDVPFEQCDGAFTSAAAQTVAFDTDSAAGLSGGANLWLGEHAGLQVLADRVSHSRIIVGVKVMR
jgi:hypothetical protein